MKPIVDILMATYNGEKYVEEQLLSILEQDYAAFHLYIRDDGSTDKTVEILKKYQSKYPEKITLLEDKQKNLGATQNFSVLMQASKAAYIAFSDQDDRWLRNKISRMMAEMLKVEKDKPERPVYIFSDLSITDGQMNILNCSLNKRDKLNPELVQTHRLLMQNVPYGCATLINKSLLEKAVPIPQEALLHDHWLALIASLFGTLAYVNEALILHRIHDNNASRAASIHKKEKEETLNSKINNKNFHNYLFKQVAQAEAILNRYERQLSLAQIKMLKDFVALKSSRGMSRKWLLIKNRFFKNYWLNTLKTIARA